MGVSKIIVIMSNYAKNNYYEGRPYCICLIKHEGVKHWRSATVFAKVIFLD